MSYKIPYNVPYVPPDKRRGRLRDNVQIPVWVVVLVILYLWFRY
jgi:hypothetical protein